MVLRSPRFLHWMARLALAAVLLLAAAPTISRWVAGVHPVAVDHAAMMMAADSGSMAMMHHAMPAPDKTPMPPMGGMHDGDACAYCPLLASLLPVLLVLAIVLGLPPRTRILAGTPVEFRTRPLLRGLGARGPPLPL